MRLLFIITLPFLCLNAKISNPKELWDLICKKIGLSPPNEHKEYKRYELGKAIKNHRIKVGKYTYSCLHSFEENVRYLSDCDDDVIIGKFCSIAVGVQFMTNGWMIHHPINAVSTYPFQILEEGWTEKTLKTQAKDNIIVGNDVWIGQGATIMPGVKIGDGAIIGAYSLVTKDVAPYTIVGGNPAKFIRKRFDDQTIDFLLKLRWWDWDIEKIHKHLPLITDEPKGENLEKLKKIYEEGFDQAS